MLAKYITTGVVGSLLLASAAFAEPPTVPQSQLQGDWRTSKVVGLSVYNDNNENVGSINELLMDKSGNIKAAVIGVGGFLGVGERLVAVPFDKLTFSNEPVASTSASNTSPPGNRPSSSTTTGSATTSNTHPAATSKPNAWYPDHAVFNAKEDELKNMTEFKYSE